jgi:hypothetical protein
MGLEVGDGLEVFPSGTGNLLQRLGVEKDLQEFEKGVLRIVSEDPT